MQEWFRHHGSGPRHMTFWALRWCLLVGLLRTSRFSCFCLRELCLAYSFLGEPAYLGLLLSAVGGWQAAPNIQHVLFPCR